jgi:hypothetical protein
MTAANGKTTIKAPTTIELAQRVDVLEWCVAELVFKMKLATAQQLLANPVVQEQLVAAIAARIT